MRISIFTPTIDSSSAYVDEAIRSVERPPGIEVEHIIVHDGSAAFTDGLLARYPFLKITHGPGKGATPAIQLGYAAATGDFIIELNSDDRLAAGSLARLAECTRAHPDIRIWTGGLRIFRTGPDGNEKTLRLVVGRSMTELNFRNVLDDLPLCNTRFFHRSAIEELGGINTDFPDSSDRELALHALLARIPEDYLGIVVGEMRAHEGSRTLHHGTASIPPYIAEHMRMADLWLARPDIPSVDRAELKSWRARETLRLAAYTWRLGMRRQAIGHIVHAISDDPVWPLRALSSIEAWRRRHRTEGERPFIRSENHPY